jgi:hypothetical protein
MGVPETGEQFGLANIRRKTPGNWSKISWAEEGHK